MKAIQKFCFCFGVLILLAANADAGRWLTRDPIEFMERDSRPTMPSNLNLGESVRPSLMEINSKSLYTYVDNNPINEVDPLGLWGIQFGNVNIGYGDPNLAFDSGSWDDLGQGAQATLDGIIPFGDPFMNNGGYDPCDKTLAWGRALGEAGRDIYLLREPELSFGKNFRIAPFGNRTSNPIGNLPHYHRRILGPNGETIPGGGIGWHRPWEKGF